MIETILLILKIIGIILLILLGLFIMLLLCVLFVPVRYRLDASLSPKREAVAKVRVSWLLHIVHISFSFLKDTEHMSCKLHLFGIPILDFLHPKEKKEKPVKTKKTKALSALEAEAANERNSDGEDILSENKSVEMNDVSETEEKAGFWHKFRRFFARLLASIKKLFENLTHIKYTITEFIKNIQDKKETVLWYVTVLQDPANKPVFDLSKRQLLKIWKRVKPRKLNIYLHVGTKEPETMGEILAVFGMLIPFLQNAVQIAPEFDQEILEGTIQMKGAISTFVFVQTAWKWFFNKDIKEFRELLTQDRHKQKSSR